MIPLVLLFEDVVVKAFVMQPALECRVVVKSSNHRHVQLLLFAAINPNNNNDDDGNNSSNNNNPNNNSNSNNGNKNNSKKDGSNNKKNNPQPSRRKKNRRKNNNNNHDDEKKVLSQEEKKQLVAKAFAWRQKRQFQHNTNNNKEQQQQQPNNNNKEKKNKKKKKNTLFDPFQVGQNVRQSLESLTRPPNSKKIPDVYLDDRFGLTTTDDTDSSSSSNVPEVLVITDEGDEEEASSSSSSTPQQQQQLGPAVVQRLVRDTNNKMRVRVLVPNLYSSILEKYGTQVTYCQGKSYDALEYAVTDVDKIVILTQDSTTVSNVLQAYQNTRTADYGSSQSAKRTLFKFNNSTNSDHHQFFAVERYYDDEYDDDDNDNDVETPLSYLHNSDCDCVWMRNDFGRGVFVGNADTATVMSSRLRASQQQQEEKKNETFSDDEGMNLSSGGFGGFVLRICGDGLVFQMVIRTGEEYGEGKKTGREYVAQFQTGSKQPPSQQQQYDDSSTTTASTTNNNNNQQQNNTNTRSNNNFSRSKFTTIRLAFESFVSNDDERVVFDGNDIQKIGFRYQAQDNTHIITNNNNNNLSSSSSSRVYGTQFYLSIHFIKVYRSQPEPELVYVTTSTPHSSSSTTHDNNTDDDDAAAAAVEAKIKLTGLAYSIIRVDNKNHNYYPHPDATTTTTTTITEPSSSSSIDAAASTIILSSSSSSSHQHNTQYHALPVSRMDVALVIAAALTNPQAMNKSLYLSRRRRSTEEEETEDPTTTMDWMTRQFSQLPLDCVTTS